MWIPQIGYAAGLVILLIAFVDEFVHVVRGNLPRYEKPKPHDRRRGGRAGDPERGVRHGPRSTHRAAPAGDPHRAARRGGVWIAIALMACGYAGMLFVGGNIPPGAVLATTVWGNSASWALAALPLFIWMGEILFRTQAVGGDVPRAGALAQLASRAADARQRAGLRHLRLGVGLVGRDLRHRRQDRAAGAEEARLRRDGQPRLARRRRHARHPHSAVDHHGDLRGAGQRLDHPGVPRRLPAGLPGDGALLRLHRRLVAAQSGQAAAARAADDVPREAAGIGAAHPDHAADPAGVRWRCCSAGRPRPNAPPGA